VSEPHVGDPAEHRRQRLCACPSCIEKLEQRPAAGGVDGISDTCNLRRSIDERLGA
jgi:hypothetical protein